MAKTVGDRPAETRVASAIPNKPGASITMERPLSPFMFPTWYRFQITSVLSILHRLTGIALAVGSILLAWGLVAVATGGGDGGAAFHRVYPTPTTDPMKVK